jgi:murein DD-endopeptidase MepM/ murein hydrolase activator NlpD
MKRKIQQEISRVKNLISETTLTSSDTLFGGSRVNIPANGSHAGQTGWQSENAWDIPADIGTPVYAIADGVLETFRDYGEKPIRVGGKTLFGVGFTVDSDGGLPDVYYTHLKDTKVKKGDRVKCGQLLGFVMDFPNSSYDHVHIGVEYGHDIREFLTKEGKIKCNGKTISVGSPIETSEVPPSSSTEEEKSLLDKILNSEFGGKKIKDLIDEVEGDFNKILKTMFDFFNLIK